MANEEGRNEEMCGGTELMRGWKKDVTLLMDGGVRRLMICLIVCLIVWLVG